MSSSLLLGPQSVPRYKCHQQSSPRFAFSFRILTLLAPPTGTRLGLRSWEMLCTLSMWMLSHLSTTRAPFFEGYFSRTYHDQESHTTVESTSNIFIILHTAASTSLSATEVNRGRLSHIRTRSNARGSKQTISLRFERAITVESMFS